MDSKIYYTIYKITNTINGKFYIGMHKTNNLDDGYMGSGKYIKRAIEKYGIENFTKEILFIFDNENNMKSKEAELVTEELCKSNTCYNICPGGHGGFGYINNHEEKKKWSSIGGKISAHIGINNIQLVRQKRKRDKDYDKKIRSAISSGIKKSLAEGNFVTAGYHSMLGKKHTNETKKKMSKSSIGSKNSQYGTMWITNGQENRKIKKFDDIPEGWYNGRTK